VAEVTFDSNLLVYAADRHAGDRHLASVALFQRAARGDSIIILQTLTEFFHVATRKVALPIETAAHLIDRWRNAFPVVSADLSCLDDAIPAYRDHRLSFWDAMLWATARRAGCRYLLSEDFQNGRTLGGVTFLNPFDPANGTALAGILPPA